DERHRFREEELLGDVTKEQIKAVKETINWEITPKMLVGAALMIPAINTWESDDTNYPVKVPLDAPIQAWEKYEAMPSEDDVSRKEEGEDAAAILAKLKYGAFTGRPGLK